MKNSIQNKLDKIINKNSDDLNAEISSKLNQARQKALTTQTKKSYFSALIYMPTAAIILLALYFIFPITQKATPQLQNNNDYIVIQELNKIEVIEQLELIDDLEFYQWLSSEGEV